ncbi:MAG: cyclic pyranopterin monophosphate synthase MoaC [Planctomycetota bacterium]
MPKKKETALSEQGFSHLDEKGRAKMVDVSHKKKTAREAIAVGSIILRKKTKRLIKERGLEKGDVLSVARIAGILAAKRTSELIPLCHPLSLTHIQIDFEWKKTVLRVSGTARTEYLTGVEMEALTAVSVALLTIYDMCKAVDKSMVLQKIHLVSKTGGKSDFVDPAWKGLST